MMNKVGVDIVRVSRLEKSLTNPTFLSRVFTQKEITYCKNKNKPINSYAAIYAAKEAICKALSKGITLAFHEIEVDHDENGAPFYNLSGATKSMCKNASLSISHDGEYAIAFCLAEVEE